MQQIHVKRYAHPQQIGYEGTVEPEDRSWVLFIPTGGGEPDLWVRRATQGDGQASEHDYAPASGSPLIDVATGERCGCSHGAFGPTAMSPCEVVPYENMPQEVLERWLADLRLARSGEEVTGIYGFGFRLCRRHQEQRAAISMEQIEAGVAQTVALQGQVAPHA